MIYIFATAIVLLLKLGEHSHIRIGVIMIMKVVSNTKYKKKKSGSIKWGPLKHKEEKRCIKVIRRCLKMKKW